MLLERRPQPSVRENGLERNWLGWLPLLDGAWDPKCAEDWMACAHGTTKCGV